MAFIELRHVSKSFVQDGVTREVLRDVNLTVERGEFVAIVGAMGAGKSTLLGLMSGLFMPDGGQVVLDGAPVTGIRSDAAIVFQNYSLLPWFSALENVRLAVEAAFPQRSRTAQREQAVRTLERVGLGRALHRRPGQLSGGMRQRVAIARALAIEPHVLFLDEPFGALDALTRAHLQDSLMDIHAELGNTIIMITHDVDEAVLLSDRIVMMTNGPAATIGEVLDINLPRPRDRISLAEDSHYNHYRSEVLRYLHERQKIVINTGSKNKTPSTSASVKTKKTSAAA